MGGIDQTITANMGKIWAINSGGVNPSIFHTFISHFHLVLGIEKIATILVLFFKRIFTFDNTVNSFLNCYANGFATDLRKL